MYVFVKVVVKSIKSTWVRYVSQFLKLFRFFVAVVVVVVGTHLIFMFLFEHCRDHLRAASQ